jgi:hypothetical protein
LRILLNAALHQYPTLRLWEFQNAEEFCPCQWLTLPALWNQPQWAQQDVKVLLWPQANRCSGWMDFLLVQE